MPEIPGTSPCNVGRRREEGKVREDWEPEDVVAAWTLVDDDRELVANKSGTTRLGFALLLKFFEQEGRFPDDLDEVPATAVAYVARQVGVEPDALGDYDWAGRSIKYWHDLGHFSAVLRRIAFLDTPEQRSAPS